jgi:hypothetical protein
VDPKAEAFYGWSGYNSNLDNPILNKDPLGDCPLCPPAAVLGEILKDALIVGGVSAGVDLAFQAGEHYMEKGSLEGFTVNKSSIGISFASGTTGVGIAAVFEKNLSQKVLLGVAASRVTDFAVGTAESAAKQATSGDGKVSIIKAGTDGAIDAVGGQYFDTAKDIYKKVEAATTKPLPDIVQKTVFPISNETTTNAVQNIVDSKKEAKSKPAPAAVRASFGDYLSPY